MADLYSELGVSRTADQAAIKKAYRRLAKELHPDRNKDNPTAAKRFARVTAAYDILSDSDKRGRYDRGEIDADGNPQMPGGFGGFRGGGPRPDMRPGGPRPGQGPGPGFEFRGDVGDLFEELLGRGGAFAGNGGFRPGPPPRGADVAYRLPLSLADAALARPQRITLRSGRTVDLAVPKGVEDGQKVRLAGQGEDGAGGAGDAIVQFQIQPDPRFVREGANLRTEVLVPLGTAVLGGRVRVPTLEGDVMAAVQPGTSSGKVLRIKGKGFTAKQGGRGDLLARLLVELPDDPALADFLRQRS